MTIEKTYPDWMHSREEFFADPFFARRLQVDKEWTFIRVPQALFQKATGLSQILSKALSTYLYLCSYINRDPIAPWGNLGELYTKGHLATFRHQRVIADALGVSIPKISTDISLLSAYNFLRVERRYWMGQDRYPGEHHGNFYYLGYWKQIDQDTRKEYLFSFGAVNKWIDGLQSNLKQNKVGSNLKCSKVAT